MAVEREISGDAFSIEPLGSMRALLLQKLLAPIAVEIGGAYAKALQSGVKLLRQRAAGDGTDEVKIDEKAPDQLDRMSMLDIDVDEVIPALARAAAQLKECDLESITRGLLSGAKMRPRGTDAWVKLFEIDGRGGTFELKMKGRTLDVWKLLLFALEVNYPDFFALLGGGASSRKAPSSSAT